MYKRLIASSLLISLIFSACGKNRSAEIYQEQIAIKAASLHSDTNSIVTTDEFTTITLIGESGSKVFINDKEIGSFPESGSLDVTFDIEKAGSYTYTIYSKNLGNKSKTIDIEIIKKDKSSSLGNISTQGEANSLTASKDGIIFIAEKNQGVEVISIGYNDEIVSVLLSTIDNIDAQNVILSDDEKKLFIEDENGRYHVLDISDLKNPKELEIIDKIEKSSSILSKDATTRYSVNSCGLISEDISNPSNITQNFFLKDEKIQDVVLVDNDSKMIIAHGEDGLQLFDLSDKKDPTLISTQDLNGNTTGLSLLEKDGILFVANGSSGVEIFDLEILLFEMMGNRDINEIP